MQVAQALALARTLGVQRLDAQLLLCRRLQQPRSWLLAHDDAELTPAIEHGFRADLAQRLDGVPLAYLSGEREFHGLRLAITPAVLDPRPDTETLVEWALEKLAGCARPRVLDLGTGSGAIAIAVAHARADATVTATDADAAALAVAQANAQAHGVALECLHGSWWQPVAARHFELVLSNPPYIAADDPHLAALRHEPQHALTPGGDGLDALRALAAGAAAHLSPGGWVLLEHGWDQAGAVHKLLQAGGLSDISSRRDLNRHERCSGARRAA